MKFAFIYHGGAKQRTPEETARVIEAWRAWFRGMGGAVFDAGNPVGKSCTVNSDGTVAQDGGANPAAGTSFILAEDLDAALELAKRCPILADGGSVEVAPVIDLDLSGK